MALALSAARTSTIGIGPAVLVPSLRHPMVNAAAIATLEDLAPGRVAVAIGAGFTGRHVLGQRPMRWADVREYIVVLRALLRGEDAEWEGATIRMIHPDGFGAARPISVPILVGADGPRGTAVAIEVGDGTFAAGRPNRQATSSWTGLLQFGTVLDDGEPLDSERVIEAAGPGLAVALHARLEMAGPEAVDRVPGGQVWREAVEQVPESRRHLAVHEGHVVVLTDRDRAALAAGGASKIPDLTLTGAAADVRARIDQFVEQGISELAYHPAGPDIPRELRVFADAVGL
jgi:5,10-methylenetetrahydromethanopterin reductase